VVDQQPRNTTNVAGPERQVANTQDARKTGLFVAFIHYKELIEQLEQLKSIGGKNNVSSTVCSHVPGQVRNYART